MVTNLKEGNKKKCEQYWPDTGSTTYGPFKITLIERQVFADYCIRTIQVTVSNIETGFLHDAVSVVRECRKAVEIRTVPLHILARPWGP
jgi:protein tyrosine phosphatase